MRSKSNLPVAVALAGVVLSVVWILVLVYAWVLSVSGGRAEGGSVSEEPVSEDVVVEAPPVDLVIENRRPGPSIFEPVFFPVDWKVYGSSFDASSESLTVRIRKGDSTFDSLQDGHVLSVSDGDRKMLFLVVECDRSDPGALVVYGIADTWYGVERFEEYR